MPPAASFGEAPRWSMGNRRISGRQREARSPRLADGSRLFSMQIATPVLGWLFHCFPCS